MNDAAAEPEKQKQVIILVHGIRDRALWQNLIRATLTDEGFKVEATNYGRFNLLAFLFPLRTFRNGAIEKVVRQITIVRNSNKDALISVIAHSFGTYVIANIIKKHFELNFYRVIFCGSVVPYDFEFEQFGGRFTPPIVNEVGTRDIWPAMAESVTTGYGSAGTYGFLRPLVHDRWHNGARHGYFLDETFCRKFWVPFLKNGEIVSAERNPEAPRLWLRSLSIFQIKYLLLLAALAILVWLVPTERRNKNGTEPPPITAPHPAPGLPSPIPAHPEPAPGPGPAPAPSRATPAPSWQPLAGQRLWNKSDEVVKVYKGPNREEEAGIVDRGSLAPKPSVRIPPEEATIDGVKWYRYRAAAGECLYVPSNDVELTDDGSMPEYSGPFPECPVQPGQ